MEPLYLAGREGRLFCLYFPAAFERPGLPALLHLPAFGDEMNRARRTVAEAARRVAEQGVAVLILDPMGTGDSEGEFEDVTWETWREDARAGLAHLRTRGHGSLGLWGLRLGSLLAADVAQHETDLRCLMLWQPVVSGEQFVNQFLRIRVTSASLGGEGGETVKGLREELAAGRAVEVAGYMLNPAMIGTLVTLKLDDLPPGCPQSLWLEVGSTGTTPGPAATRVMKRWQAADSTAHAEVVPGAPFWSTQEISTSLSLIRRSAQWLPEQMAS